MTQLDLSIAFEVTKTNASTKKREPVGIVQVPMPSLQLIKQQLMADTLERTERMADAEGVPEYTTDFANWLMRAVRSAVLSNARNKLNPGTVELRAGASIPSDLASLVAPPSAGGNGVAFAELAALRSSFNEWVDTLGKQPKTAALIKAMFKDAKTFALQPPEAQAKLMPYFEQYLALAETSGLQLTSVQVAHFEKLAGAADSEDEEDFDDL